MQIQCVPISACRRIPSGRWWWSSRLPTPVPPLSRTHGHIPRRTVKEVVTDRRGCSERREYQYVLCPVQGPVFAVYRADYISTGDDRRDRIVLTVSLTVSAHAGSIDSPFGRAEQPYNRAPRGQPIGCRYGPWWPSVGRQTRPNSFCDRSFTAVSAR